MFVPTNNPVQILSRRSLSYLFASLAVWSATSEHKTLQAADHLILLRPHAFGSPLVAPTHVSQITYLRPATTTNALPNTGGFLLLPQTQPAGRVIYFQPRPIVLYGNVSQPGNPNLQITYRWKSPPALVPHCVQPQTVQSGARVADPISAIDHTKPTDSPVQLTPRTFEGESQKTNSGDVRVEKSDSAAAKKAELKIPSEKAAELTPGPKPDAEANPQPKAENRPDVTAIAATEKAVEPKPGKTPAKPERKDEQSRKPQSRKNQPLSATPLLAWNLPESFRSRQPRTARDSHEIASRDQIRIDARNGLDLSHGWVQFPVSSKGLLQGIQKSKQLTIVAHVTCQNEAQAGPARILSCSKDSNERNFTLAQDGKKFVIRIRSSADDSNGIRHETSFGRVTPGKAQQIAVRYDGRVLECFIDGELVAERKFKTDFASWERYPVVAGNEFTADRPWAGTIHSLAVLPTADQRLLKPFFQQK